MPAGDVNSCRDEYIVRSWNREHWRRRSCVCVRERENVFLFHSEKCHKGSHPKYLRCPPQRSVSLRSASQRCVHMRRSVDLLRSWIWQGENLRSQCSQRIMHMSRGARSASLLLLHTFSSYLPSASAVLTCKCHSAEVQKCQSPFFFSPCFAFLHLKWHEHTQRVL